MRSMSPADPPAKALTKNPLGPTGQAVAANVERLRTEQNLTFAALAERLDDIGRPIPTLGLRKIVAQTRRVDSDDLVALAVAFGVSPVSLLMPGLRTVGQFDQVEFTGLPLPVRAEVGWLWLTAQDLPTPDSQPLGTSAKFFAFLERSCPPWVSSDLAERWRAQRRQSNRDLVEAGWLDEEDVADGDD